MEKEKIEFTERELEWMTLMNTNRKGMTRTESIIMDGRIQCSRQAHTARFITSHTEPVMNDEGDVIDYKPKEGKEELVKRLRCNLILDLLDAPDARTARTVSWYYLEESYLDTIPMVHNTGYYWNYTNKITHQEIKEAITSRVFQFRSGNVVTVKFGNKENGDNHSFKVYRPM